MKEINSDCAGADFYDELLSEYDQMMDWESRLERETPFFEKIFNDYGIKSALDISCGTGRYCFHFRTMGVESVVGADPSAKAVEMARARASTSGSDVRFVQASLTDAADHISGRFNLVCSLGNSISHLLKYDDLELALKNMRQLLSDRGIVVVQCLNWDYLLAHQERFSPLKSHSSKAGEKLFFKFFDYHDELVTLNLVIFQQNSAPSRRWSSRILSTTLRPWRREILRMAVEDNGLSVDREYGCTGLSSYDPAESSDYIFIARKA